MARDLDSKGIRARRGRRAGELVVLEGDAPDGGDESDQIRVLIADGQTLVRAGFRVLLQGQNGIAVAGDAADGEGAVAAARELRPDVVLVDIDLPGLDGLEVTRQILSDPELEGVKVLVLTTHERDEDVFGALRAGATGLLLKDTEPRELVQAVRVVAGGEALLSPSVTRRLIDELASQPDSRRPTPEELDELTAREREVMALVATGLTNDEIAEQLVVSPATAKTHVSRAMMKLHARHRAQLVVLAYETGLVMPRPNGASWSAGVPAQAPALVAA